MKSGEGRNLVENFEKFIFNLEARSIYKSYQDF